MRLSAVAAALLVASFAVHAQTAPSDRDGRATPSPTPPPLDVTDLISLEIPGSALRFGVAPGSVSIGSDRIVRYVVVATSASGVVNAIYEGIRCETGDFQVYARHTPDSGWVAAKEPLWRSLHAQPTSRHSLLIARTGACVGRGANRSATQVVRDLRSPVDSRFSNEARP